MGAKTCNFIKNVPGRKGICIGINILYKQNKTRINIYYKRVCRLSRNGGCGCGCQMSGLGSVFAAIPPERDLVGAVKA